MSETGGTAEEPSFVLDVAIPYEDQDAAMAFSWMLEEGVRRQNLGQVIETGLGMTDDYRFRDIAFETKAPGLIIHHYLWKLPRGTRYSLRPDDEEKGT